MGFEEGAVADIEVTHLEKPDGIWVTVSGEIDVSNASAFADGLQAAIADSGRPIVLDLAGVTFMDSSGVRELVIARESVGPRLRVAALHRSVRRVLELASLLDLFEVSTDGDASIDPTVERDVSPAPVNGA